MDKHYSCPTIIILLLFCKGFVSVATAQQGEKLLLKPDILALFQHTPAIQLRAEYKLSPKTSIQTTAGFGYGTFYTVFNDPQSPDYDALHLKSFSTKAEYRYYLTANNTLFQGIYVAPEIAYKYVTYQQGRFFYVYTPNNINYEKFIEYTVRKNTYIHHIKLGYQEKISNRIYIDVFGGIGRRIITLKNNIKIPDDALRIEESSSFTSTFLWGYKGTKTRLSFTASVLLGIML